MQLVSSNTPELTTHPATLEDILSTLSSFGSPKILNMTSGGWYAYLEVSTTAAGVKIEIASELDHSSALQAARTCLERTQVAMLTTIRKL